ncbi:MAG: hypothetical protein LUQ65_03025 [Candidatus Helarchaeota archaeon]|nr:hypothetical protein [Candidatus Helarchaeota archaeon]
MNNKRNIIMVIFVAVPFLLVGSFLGKCWWNQYGTIKRNNFTITAPTNADSIPLDALVNYVDVRKTDLNIDSPSSEFMKMALHNLFFGTEHVKMFDRLSTDDWEKKWNEYKSRLLAEAQAKGLDAASLQTCFSKIEPKVPVVLLPVEVYFAKNGKQDIWIIVCKWGWPGENYGHVRGFVFNSKTAKLIGFATCS